MWNRKNSTYNTHTERQPHSPSHTHHLQTPHHILRKCFLRKCLRESLVDKKDGILCFHSLPSCVNGQIVCGHMKSLLRNFRWLRWMLTRTLVTHVVPWVSPVREEGRQVLSNYPKLSKTNTFPHTNTADQAITQQTTADTDFLPCTAAALEDQGRHVTQGQVRQEISRQTVEARGRKERIGKLQN